MRTTRTIFLIIFLLTILVCCKKTKLDGGFSKLVGSWTWAWTNLGQGGLETPTTTGYSLRLELEEKGKYKLYKDNKKIEYGRLQEDNGFIKFVGDDFINKKDDMLRGTKILKPDNDTIVTGLDFCCDIQTMTFIKN